MFQLALPRRERRCRLLCLSARLGFNSRSREGSDYLSKRGVAFGIRFNSRSREGSDPIARELTRWVFLFQLALPRRERPTGNGEPIFECIVSTRAPAKGATVIIILLFVS